MYFVFMSCSELWDGHISTKLRVCGPCAENNIPTAALPLVFTRSDHVLVWSGLTTPERVQYLVLKELRNRVPIASPHLATAPLRRRKWASVERASRPLQHRLCFRERTYRCDYPRCARWARPATRSAVRSPRTGKCWRRRRRRRCLSWSLLHWRAAALRERKGDRAHSHARAHRQTDRQTAVAAAGAAQHEREREEGPTRHTCWCDTYCTLVLLQSHCACLYGGFFTWNLYKNNTSSKYVTT